MQVAAGMEEAEVVVVAVLPLPPVVVEEMTARAAAAAVASVDAEATVADGVVEEAEEEVDLADEEEVRRADVADRIKQRTRIFVAYSPNDTALHTSLTSRIQLKICFKLPALRLLAIACKEDKGWR
jgi:hypothetical protein